MNEYEVVFSDGGRQVIKASEHRSRGGFVNFFGPVPEKGRPDVLLRLREEDIRSIRLLTGDYVVPPRQRVTPGVG